MNYNAKVQCNRKLNVGVSMMVVVKSTNVKKHDLLEYFGCRARHHYNVGMSRGVRDPSGILIPIHLT